MKNANEFFEAEAAKGRADRVARDARFAAQKAAPARIAAANVAGFAEVRKLADSTAKDLAEIVAAVVKNPAPAPTAEATSAEIAALALAMQKRNKGMTYREALNLVTTRQP